MYNVVESPLGQPRNTFFGTIVSSFVGIAITKLFMLNSNDEQYLWVAGALCVGVASIAMSLTKTVHPPGGAAALLCAIDVEVRGLGWFYLVVQIVAGLEILAVACLFNNIQRKYPLYWWTPNSLRATGPIPPAVPPAKEALSPVVSASAGGGAFARLERVLSDRHVVGTTTNDTGDIQPSDLKNLPASAANNLVLILPSHFSLPKGLELTEEEEALLVNIQDQLKSTQEALQARDSSDNNV